MTPLYSTKSNSFTTSDWVRSTDGTIVSGYNSAESNQSTNSEEHFTQSDFESALRKASRPVTASRSVAKTK
jgi:hypothetical protein